MTARLLLYSLLLLLVTIYANAMMTMENGRVIAKMLNKREIKVINSSTKMTDRPARIKHKITTSRPEDTKSEENIKIIASPKLHKTFKDKKEGIINQVLNDTTKSPHNSYKTQKDKNSKLTNENVVAPAAELKGAKNNPRQHKAIFVNYPSGQHIYQDKAKKPISSGNRKKPMKKQKPTKHKGESDIYYIRLPPTPYSYIPGLGYISQPPSFSTASLAAAANSGKRPQQQYHKPRPPGLSSSSPAQQQPVQNPFIKVPIEFVSNGKPTSVYRWPQQPAKDQHNNHYNHNIHKFDSPIIRLNRGPYYFNGRPNSIYTLKKNSRPTIPNYY